MNLLLPSRMDGVKCVGLEGGCRQVGWAGRTGEGLGQGFRKVRGPRVGWSYRWVGGTWARLQVGGQR